MFNLSFLHFILLTIGVVTSSETSTSVKLCVSTTDFEKVIGATVQCNNSTTTTITNSDGCTAFMTFPRDYPFILTCEISGECVETTNFQELWRGPGWFDKKKSAQAKVAKLNENCSFSLSPSSNLDERNGSNEQNNSSNTGPATEVLVGVISSISIVALLVIACWSDCYQLKANSLGSETSNNDGSCCKSCCEGCCLTIDCCCQCFSAWS